MIDSYASHITLDILMVFKFYNSIDIDHEFPLNNERLFPGLKQT